MRTLLIALALAIVTLPTLAEAQSCRELRRACEMRDQLGERGQGNCRRYREACEQQPDCAALRQALCSGMNSASAARATAAPIGSNVHAHREANHPLIRGD